MKNLRDFKKPGFFQSRNAGILQSHGLEALTGWGEAPNLEIFSFDTGVFTDLRQLFKMDKKWNVPEVLI
jgi:hypothetical protein